MAKLTPTQIRLLVVGGAMLLMPLVAMLAITAVLLFVNALAGE
jgi:hypothetical protein